MMSGCTKHAKLPGRPEPRGRGLRHTFSFVLLLCAGVSAWEAAAAPSKPTAYTAEIRWTRYGIPHIDAQDFGGLGFGAGYAFAEQNACLLFDTALTVRGERSQYLGPQAEATPGFATTRNIDSDIFFRSYFDVGKLVASYREGSPEVLALLRGYIAGANRYLVKTGLDRLPIACRDAPWIRPLAFDDIVLMVAQKAVEASGSAFISAILSAVPPHAIELPAGTSVPVVPPTALPKPSQAGSNAYALGKDLTATGHGILVGNPHFPWTGHNRFFEMQLTIPGRLDVMGATLLPLPVINIGFNRDVAWSHTVSTGHHFTLFELHLVSGHPLEYLVDGRIEMIQPKTVIVPSVDEHGILSQITHTVYETRFGPIVAEPAKGLRWTSETAFALADAEVENPRIVEQWLRLNEAKNVSDIRAALSAVQGAPWVNTVAADRAGAVLYADYSVVPIVSDTLLQDCKPSILAQQFATKSGMPVLDGSRSDCDWRGSKSDGREGIMSTDYMPSLIRSDFVLNSNDSFWLANSSAPLTGYASIIGPVNTAQRWRTRMGYKALHTLIAGKGGKITAADLEHMLLSDRNYAGELIADDLISLCRLETPLDPSQASNIAAGCRALRGWDRMDTVGSHGAPFFREFWRRAGRTPDLWRTPFNKDDPLRTPTGLNLADAAVVKALQTALVETVQQFQSLGFEPDVPLGAVQRRDAVPVPGGAEFEGVLNNITLGPLSQSGYANSSVAGSSYMQVVTWAGAEPVADSLLTYSQSSDPASPHYTDQTREYVKSAWIRLPFTRAEISADPMLKIEKVGQ